MDPYNQTLLSNVRPAGWKNPEPDGTYSLLVVGAGTAGLVTAAGAAGLGAKTALVEKYLMGGDCLNTGCVPSKSMIRSARAAADVRDAPKFGLLTAGSAGADFPAVMERMRRLRSGISRHDSAERFKGLGVDVFLGEARFTGKNQVDVGGKTLRFKKAVLATGARAARPAIPGIEEAGFLTNETVFNLTALPRRLLVIGAGPIGCELAQAFRRLGSEVHIFEAMHGFLPREDRDAAAVLEAAFRKENVRSLCCCKIERVERRGAEKIVRFTAEHEGGRPQELAVDEILVGAGRVPNVDGLGLESAGIRYDLKTGVRVNDYLQTTNPDVYAAGDVCLKHKFTHAADASARVVLQNALFFNSKKWSSQIVPWCTYTDPEIAHVGLYEREIREKGMEAETYVREMKDVDRAVTDGDEEGWVKVHLRRGSDRILGATIVARRAGDLISEITLAMNAGIGLGRISGVIHPYPTQAEAVKQAADAYNRTRLTPFVRKLLRLWLNR